jgi:solute carrier family 13 (sodium-dependent dicarboxylate transporter), member 2/3/5
MENYGAPVVRKVPLLAGLVLFIAMLLIDPPELFGPAGWRALAVAMLMITWWIGEALPLPATALLPILLFPLLDVTSVKKAAAPFAHPLLFLFLGGFLLGAAISGSGLHKRLSFAILRLTGAGSSRLVAGFLLAGALSSMWISNTASAVMLLPVAQAALAGAPQRLHKALLLAVAYGCSIGGVATLIGTPPNAMLAAYLDQAHGHALGFGEWMLIGLPVSLLLLALAWLVLTHLAFGKIEQLGAEALPEPPGPMTAREKRIAIILALTALAWIFRPALAVYLPALSDTAIALFAGLILFAIPSGGLPDEEQRPLLTWEEARGIHWGVLLLFGGGLSLASALTGTGLAATLAASLSHMVGELPAAAATGLSVFTVLMATELTSNTASAAAFLPIMAGMAQTLGLPLFAMLAPVTLAASCAFMMPVATPPNAIVFGAGGLRVADMVRAGIWMNAGAVIVLTALGWVLLQLA